MPLSDRAVTRSIDLLTARLKAAAPHINWDLQGPHRSLLLIPGGVVSAAPIQRTESVRRQSFADAESLSRRQLADLLTLLLEEIPQGTRSRTVVDIYTNSPQPFSLGTFGYFIAQNGTVFAPAMAYSVRSSDYRRVGSEYVVSVPVVAMVVGSEGRVGVGAISDWRDLPIEPLRVSNPRASVGGDDELEASQLLDRIGETRRAGGILQSGGMAAEIYNVEPDARHIRSHGPGDPWMMRDEYWLDSEGIPNLSRRGEPYATHRALGTLTPSTSAGRLVASSDVFLSTDVGKRLVMDGDPLGWRRILKVVSAREVVVNGETPESSASAKIWGDGPRAGSMSDVYFYMPTPRLYSKIINRSWRVAAASTHVISPSDLRFYYAQAPGTAYSDFGEAGWLVFDQGLSSERSYRVTGTGSDLNGSYLSLGDEAASVAVTQGTLATFWDMRKLVAGRDLDVRPVIHVLRIEQLDPISLQPLGAIERTYPGEYASPGWYNGTSDGALDFSVRSEREIALDDKSTYDSHVEQIFGSSPVIRLNTSKTLGVTTTSPTVQITLSSSVSGVEGRPVSYAVDETLASDSSSDVTDAAATRSIDKTTMTVTGLNARYLSDLGYRDQDVTVTLKFYNGGGSFIASQTFTSGEVQLAGGKIKIASGQFDSGDVAASYKVSVAFAAHGSLHTLRPAMAATRSSVVLGASGTTLSFDDVGLVTMMDKDGHLTTIGSIVISEDFGAFGRGPVRVTWASHESYSRIQTELAEAGRALADDTLIRSFRPALIDLSLDYQGPASEAEVQAALSDLFRDAQIETADGVDLKISISNILASIDADGLTDTIDTNPQVRVEVFRDDGLSSVWYANPSTSVKQSAALLDAVSPSDETITIQAIEDVDELPGRGKIKLGGRDPDRQEILHYEAVILSNDGTTAELVLRPSTLPSSSHWAWQEVVLMDREFDEQRQFDDEIIIPSSCRPYLQRLSLNRSAQ